MSLGGEVEWGGLKVVINMSNTTLTLVELNCDLNGLLKIDLHTIFRPQTCLKIYTSLGYFIIVVLFVI